MTTIAARAPHAGAMAATGTATASASPSAAAPAATEGAAAAASGAAISAARATLQRGIGNWDQGLQTRVAGAQQARDFLDRSTGQLHALKSELAATLGGRDDRADQLATRLRQVRDGWQQRARAAGGTLDGQLAFSADAPAVQRFGVAGLSLARLRGGVRETLTFATGAGQPLRAVSLDAGLPDAELVQRLDHALAPSQVRVAAGPDGALVLSTPEANYANVRDALAIQGGGSRFPAGQLHRVTAEPEQGAITPDGWRIDDVGALRHTLAKVTQALAAVAATRATVDDALAVASAATEAAAAPADGSEAMTALARQFAGAAAVPGYAALLATKPALAGVTRERTSALLRLR